MERNKDKKFINNIELYVNNLFNKLSLAKEELLDLRKDLQQLNDYQADGINEIQLALKSWNNNEPSTHTNNEQEVFETEDSIEMKPIGVISTCFTEKKSTPRQPCICDQSRGKLTLFNTVYTNPDHALQGLQEFSHMWILFHFHKTHSTHTRAKVAPPRLDGKRTGVFSTRCPHRPCPIGLSLVHIDRVDGSSIYFSGVDMLNGTPVFDIKPYIPLYDNPNFSHESNYKSATLSNNANDYDERADNNSYDECVDPTTDTREAPDGEEHSALDNCSSELPSPSQQVRVPDWITHPVVPELTVTFKCKALANLENLATEDAGCDDITNNDGKDIKGMITNILRQDPRSVYVRERYSNQFYTFLIGKYHVSCKFDDTNHAVQVYRVNRATPLEGWRSPVNDSH